MLPDGAIGGRADEASPGVDTIDRQRIRARLGVLIAHPPPGSIPITITPQMAEVMLERNLDNRPLSHMHVESLAKSSEERRVGKECGSTCRSRWSPYH